MDKNTTQPQPPPLADTVQEFRAIRKEYQYDDSIFNDEPRRVAHVKYIVNNRLNLVDRTLIILYADCHNYRKLGERLGVSHTTVFKEIRRIRKEILRIYDEMNKDAIE